MHPCYCNPKQVPPKSTPAHDEALRAALGPHCQGLEVWRAHYGFRGLGLWGLGFRGLRLWGFGV